MKTTKKNMLFGHIYMTTKGVFVIPLRMDNMDFEAICVVCNSVGDRHKNSKIEEIPESLIYVGVAEGKPYNLVGGREDNYGLAEPILHWTPVNTLTVDGLDSQVMISPCDRFGHVTHIDIRIQVSVQKLRPRK